MDKVGLRLIALKHHLCPISNLKMSYLRVSLYGKVFVEKESKINETIVITYQLSVLSYIKNHIAEESLKMDRKNFKSYIQLKKTK